MSKCKDCNAVDQTLIKAFSEVVSLGAKKAKQNYRKAILSLLTQRDKELLEKIKGMKRIVKYKRDGGCINCGYTASGCVCAGFNQALSDIEKLIK